MQETIIALDVGGTTIKGNVFKGSSSCLPSPLVFPALSDGTKEMILDNLLEILDSLQKEADAQTPDFVLMAFPGPFDYGKGIPLLRGISKFESLFGIDLEAELKKRDGDRSLAATSFLFLNDIDAFALGVIEEESILEDGKVLFLTLGTGLGSAFAVDGAIAKEGEGIPENGWVYNLPYGTSILDDHFSARGLQALALEMTGQDLSGNELCLLADKGDQRAKETFSAFGKKLKEALEPIILGFRPKAVVFGGNITKAHSYFGAALEEFASANSIRIIYRNDTSSDACRGLARYYRRNHDIQL